MALRYSNDLGGGGWGQGKHGQEDRGNSTQLQTSTERRCEEKSHCPLLAGYCMLTKTATFPGADKVMV